MVISVNTAPALKREVAEVVGGRRFADALRPLGMPVEVVSQQAGDAAVDSPAEAAGRTEPKAGDKVPLRAKLQHELRGLGLSIEAVRVTRDDGELAPETRAVLRAVARHGLILAAGHLGPRDDTFAVVEGAFEEGVEHVAITHSEFTCQNFSIEKRAAMAEMNAQAHVHAYYGELAERRGNHARRLSGNKEIRYAEAFQRVTPQVVDAL